MGNSLCAAHTSFPFPKILSQIQSYARFDPLETLCATHRQCFAFKNNTMCGIYIFPLTNVFKTSCCNRQRVTHQGFSKGKVPKSDFKKKLVTLLDLCVSSLRRGHANLLCIVPILTDGNPEGNPCILEPYTPIKSHALARLSTKHGLPVSPSSCLR